MAMGEFPGFETRHGVELDGDACDVHVRLDVASSASRQSYIETGAYGIAWCGVYVKPARTELGTERAGYWFFPTGEAAVTVAVRAGIRVAPEVMHHA